MDNDPLHDFELLIRSRYGALQIETAEEDRAAALAERAAWQLQLPLFVWRRATGLRRAGAPSGVYGSEDPRTALGHVIDSQLPALYVFHGLGPELDKPEVADLLREAAERLGGHSGAVVLTGGDVRLPESLRTVVGLVHVPAPTREEYEDLQRRVVRELSARMGVQVSLTPADQDRLLANLQGLTLAESEKLLTRLIVEDGRLDADDITRVAEAKRELVERDGLLEYQPTTQSLEEIADLVQLKEWLGKRRLFMEDPRRAADFGLEFPRGILLVGVPGCGKSLCAKAVAAAWGLPLVDSTPARSTTSTSGRPSRTLQGRVRGGPGGAAGAVDRRDREGLSLQAAATMAAERLRAAGHVSLLAAGAPQQVFIVATANDIQRLPPN